MSVKGREGKEGNQRAKVEEKEVMGSGGKERRLKGRGRKERMIKGGGSEEGREVGWKEE